MRVMATCVYLACKVTPVVQVRCRAIAAPAAGLVDAVAGQLGVSGLLWMRWLWQAGLCLYRSAMLLCGRWQKDWSSRPTRTC
jgi:hypothetical protein